MEEYEIARSKDFANRVMHTVNYCDANQYDHRKVWRDHYISKISEEGVGKYYRARGCEVEGPDYKIYTGKQKSWEKDLKINGVGVSVKAQSIESMLAFGLSWSFGNSVRRDPVLYDPDAWIIFTLVQDSLIITQVQIYEPRQVKELVFGNPRLERLKGKKLVVYAEDIYNA